MRVERLERTLLAADSPAITAASRFWPHRPTDSAGLQAVATKIPIPGAAHRQQLSNALTTYNQLLGNAAGVTRAGQLAEAGTLCVVTGQQAGLFTGPLYTIYKTASAIRLAAAAEQQLQRPVVPIFWNATEDHDLSEIAECCFPEQTFRAEFVGDGRAAEALRMSAGGMAAVAAICEQVAGQPHAAAIAELLRVAHDHYGEYSSAVVARLFADTGLVLLEPRLLRPLAVPLLQAAVRQGSILADALDHQAEALADAGISAAFQDARSSGMFHLDAAGCRRRIQRRDDGFELPDGTLLEAEALIDRVADAPQQFSAAAWLRPLLQCWCLPTAAYVAGPSEFTYHLQLRPLFEALDIVPPALCLRHHATLLGAREQRLAAQLRLRPADLAGPRERHYGQVELPAPVTSAFRAATASLDQLAENLARQSGDLLPPQSLDAFLRTTGHELARLQKRSEREWARRQGVDNARVDRLMAAVLPHDQPQERRINILYFLQQSGPQLIPALLRELAPFDDRHHVFFLADNGGDA